MQTDLWSGRGALLAIAVAIAASAQVAFAQSLPEFAKGKWEFTRTIESGGGKPQVISNTRCASPSDDMRARRDQASKAGCKMSPVSKSGSTYTYSVSCVVQGAPLESKSVMSVENPRAYKVQIQSSQGGKSTKELLVAKRVGDC